MFCNWNLIKSVGFNAFFGQMPEFYLSKTGHGSWSAVYDDVYVGSDVVYEFRRRILIAEARV
jgi:hypothetical protein